MKEITADNLLEFEKYLIELGGIYKLCDDLTIENTTTEKKVAIQEGTGNKLLVVFKQGMPCGDYALLNPFKEVVGTSRPREWFFNTTQQVVAGLIKSAMIKICKDIVDKNDENNLQFPLMSRIMDKVDATTIDELDKIRTSDIFIIFYNKKTRTAEAQCNLFTEEFKSAHSKFRKKTWDVLSVFTEEFFGSTDLEEFTYQAKSTLIPQTDAVLNVLVGVINSVQAWIKDILGIDLHATEIGEHMEVLEGYAKLYAWVSTGDATKSAANVASNVPPWQQQPAWVNNDNSGGLLPSSQVGNNPYLDNGGSGTLVPSSQVGESFYGFNQQPASCAAGPLGVPSTTPKPLVF